MATIRNFIKELNDALAHARANGLTDVKILQELFTEAVTSTEVLPVTPKEVLPVTLTEVLPVKSIEPMLTITAIPSLEKKEVCQTVKQILSYAAKSKKMLLPAKHEEVAISLPAKHEEVSAPIAKVAKEIIHETHWAELEGSNSSAAASPTEDFKWRIFAMAGFEDFTPVPAKSNDWTIIFQTVPFQGMHKAIFTADSKLFSTKGLREFIVKKDAAAFSTWIQDTMNWSKGLDADGNREFALRKLIQLFIPFFFKHNLKDYYNKKKGDFPTVEHMEYCISNVVTVTTAKKMNPMRNDLRTYFKLSAEEAPSEAILREVAVIQAMQQFVLKEIHTILSLSKIGKSIVRMTDFLQLEFHTQEGFTKFSDTIKYDQKINGWL